MPLLATLIKALFGNVLALVLLLKSSERAAKIAGAVVLAGTYLAAVTVFTSFISPLLGSLFASGIGGTVIGLAFPPMAGTVIAGLSAIWGVLLMQRYYRWVYKIGVG